MSVVNRSVLALNSTWFPVDVISVKDAFRLVSKEHAKILETINETYMLHTLDSWLDIHMHELYSKINTVSLEIPVPEIVVLSHYDDIPIRIMTFSKQNLLIRDKFKCMYCQTTLTEDSMTVDHVVPQAKGGKTNWENCVCACSKCNHEKADNPPIGRFKPKVKPREPAATLPMHKINKTHKDHEIPESWKKFLFRN